jgi:hypothetical protein
MADTFDDWKAALANAAQLHMGGAISPRELADIKTQAMQSGAIPVGSSVFGSWNDALAHAQDLRRQGRISPGDLDQLIQSSRIMPPTSGQLSGGVPYQPNAAQASGLDRIREFLSNFTGPRPAY